MPASAGFVIHACCERALRPWQGCMCRQPRRDQVCGGDRSRACPVTERETPLVFELHSRQFTFASLWQRGWADPCPLAHVPSWPNCLLGRQRQQRQQLGKMAPAGYLMRCPADSHTYQSRVRALQAAQRRRAFSAARRLRDSARPGQLRIPERQSSRLPRKEGVFAGQVLRSGAALVDQAPVTNDCCDGASPRKHVQPVAARCHYRQCRRRRCRLPPEQACCQ